MERAGVVSRSWGNYFPRHLNRSSVSSGGRGLKGKERMSAIFGSRAPRVGIVAALLALTASTVDNATAAPYRAPGPSADAVLPILRLAGGPPRSLDNVWLGFN